MRRLRKMEQQLENKRISALKKLESSKEKLLVQKSIAAKKASVKQTKLRAKQAIINEINREKNALRKLEAANAKARKEMRELSNPFFVRKQTGKQLENKRKTSKGVLAATKAFMKKKSTQKALKAVGNVLDRWGRLV